MAESGVDVADHLHDLRVTNLELAQRIKVYLINGTAGCENRDVQSEWVGRKIEIRRRFPDEFEPSRCSSRRSFRLLGRSGPWIFKRKLDIGADVNGASVCSPDDRIAQAADGKQRSNGELVAIRF
jgi:hypothetical protein